MLRCMERVQQHVSSGITSVADTKNSKGADTHKGLSDVPPADARDGKALGSAESLINTEEFRRLLKIHNNIQAVQCFQYPPNALCCDSKELVREVRIFNDLITFCLLGSFLFHLCGTTILL